MLTFVYIVTSADLGLAEDIGASETLEELLTASRAVYSTFEAAKAYAEKQAANRWLDAYSGQVEDAEFPGLEWIGTFESFASAETVYFEGDHSISEEWDAIAPDENGEARDDLDYSPRYRITRVQVD